MLGPRLTNQIIHWPLTEGSGTTIKEQVTGTALTMASGITWNNTNEPTISCASASGGFLSQPALLNIKRFTAMGWFYCDSAAGYRPVMSFGDSSTRTSLFFTQGTMMALWNNLSGWSYGPANAPLNRWVHLTWVISDASLLKFYFDGRLVYTMALGTLSNTPGTMCLGTTGIAEYYSGRMKDVRVFNKLLTDGEIFRACHSRTSIATF